MAPPELAMITTTEQTAVDSETARILGRLSERFKGAGWPWNSEALKIISRWEGFCCTDWDLKFPLQNKIFGKVTVSLHLDDPANPASKHAPIRYLQLQDDSSSGRLQLLIQPIWGIGCEEVELGPKKIEEAIQVYSPPDGKCTITRSGTIMMKSPGGKLF